MLLTPQARFCPVPPDFPRTFTSLGFHTSGERTLCSQAIPSTFLSQVGLPGPTLLHCLTLVPCLPPEALLAYSDSLICALLSFFPCQNVGTQWRETFAGLVH